MHIRRIAELQGQIEELNTANRKLAIQADHIQNIEPQLARFREGEPELKRLRTEVNELNLMVVFLKDRIKDVGEVFENKINELQQSINELLGYNENLTNDMESMDGTTRRQMQPIDPSS